MDKKSQKSDVRNQVSDGLKSQAASRKFAFTLVEVLIVVAILGILAAIVMPEVQGYTEKAKENAAKDNLRILREAIGRYAGEHNDVSPGYLNGNTSSTPSTGFVSAQLVYRATNTTGGLANFGTAGYPYGPYLLEIPQNPLNGKQTVLVIGNTTDFPTNATNTYGWVYKPLTKEVRLDSTGTDNEGDNYYDY